MLTSDQCLQALLLLLLKLATLQNLTSVCNSTCAVFCATGMNETSNCTEMCAVNSPSDQTCDFGLANNKTGRKKNN